jgi:hypothetical protein
MARAQRRVHGTACVGCCIGSSGSESFDAMKLLIRKAKEKLYLTSDGNWTNERAQGREFENVIEAVNHASQMNLPDLELYYAFANREHDVVVPIDPLRLKSEAGRASE